MTNATYANIFMLCIVAMFFGIYLYLHYSEKWARRKLEKMQEAGK